MLQRSILHKKNEGKSLNGYQFISSGFCEGREVISVQRPKTCIPRNIQNHKNKKESQKQKKVQEPVKQNEQHSFLSKKKQKSKEKKSQKSKSKNSVRSNRMEEYLSDFRALKNSEITKAKMQYLMERKPFRQIPKKQKNGFMQQAKCRQSNGQVLEMLKQLKEKQFTKETILRKSWLLLTSSKIHSGLFIMNLGSKKYQRISEELMTTFFYHQIYDLKLILRSINRFSTDLDQNVFYLLFTMPQPLLQNINARFYFKDSHIRFFLINRPIHHSQRASIRTLIAQFLIQNYSILRQQKKLSTSSGSQETNSIYLVVDNRGCVSIIRNQELNGSFFQSSQLQSLNDKISQKRLEETQIQTIIESFSQACKIRLNLEIAHINCLFSKGPI